MTKQLPSKITPDNLRDAIVDIRFLPKVPESAVVGYLHQLLSKAFEVIDHSRARRTIPILPGIEMLTVADRHPVYTNDEVRIIAQDNQLFFNIAGTYPGWDAYFKTIKSVLRDVFGAGIIDSFGKVGLRYISEHPNTSVFDCLKGSFSILKLAQPLQTTQIRSELSDGHYKAVINLRDNFPKQDKKTQTVDYFSLIDIDMQYHGPQTNNLESLLEIVNIAHEKEKQIFFGIVTEEFVKQRNPEFKK